MWKRGFRRCTDYSGQCWIDKAVVEADIEKSAGVEIEIVTRTSISIVPLF
jgi:hypothetical protein